MKTVVPEASALPGPAAVAAAGRYARSREGRVSFALVDTQGRLRGKDVARGFPSASVVKAMLLVAYLSGSERRDRSLEEDEESLLAPMITESDNAAATAVASVVGGAGLSTLADRAGMRGFAPADAWGRSVITAADQARFFARLDRLLPARHRAFARRQLAGIVDWQRWGIHRSAPRGWRTFFKGGWRPTPSGQLVHQIARLEAGGRRISLAVLTDANPTHDYGVRTVEGVAARVLEDLPAPRSRPSVSRPATGHGA